MTAVALEASVVVALNPHANDLATVFGAFLRQTMPAGSFEVIVADGGTRPEAPAAYAEHRRAHPDSPVRLVPAARSGRAAANNAGARAARSSLVIFVADDFIPAPTLVRAHAEFHRHLQQPGAGVGPALFPRARRADPLCRWLEDSGRLFAVPFRLAEQHWPQDFFYVGNASLRRELFECVGGFDETFPHDAFDDHEFGVRLAAAGVRTHFLPKAIAWHDHALDLAERSLAMRRSGEAARACVARFGAARPWASVVARPLAEVEAAVARTEAALRDGASALAASEHYAALMDLAYARGYHGAPAA